MSVTSESGVPLRERLEWAWDQAPYLTPTQQHVLLYLVSNAFLSNDNPENEEHGTVYRGRTTFAKIQEATSLSRSTVHRALDDLVQKMFILADMKPGKGVSQITILWTEGNDYYRDEVRRGVRGLPDHLQEPEMEEDEDVEDTPDAVVLQFPGRFLNVSP